MLPDTLWGAPLIAQPELQQQPQSITLLTDLLRQTTIEHSQSSTTPSGGHFTNPSDSAALHLAALLFPDVQNERIFAPGGSWTRASVEHTVKRLLAACSHLAANGGPVLQTLWEADTEERSSADVPVFKDGDRAETLLRRMTREGWRSLEESLKGCIEGFTL